MTQSIKRAVVQVAQQMAVADLSMGTSGNVSARVEDGIIAITPSGVPYQDLTEGDIVLVDIVTGQVVEGVKKASSETPMHSVIYRDRPDIHAIVHTHSLYATAFAAMGRPLEAVHYVIATMGTTVPVVPYFLYGSNELAHAAAATLAQGKAALLQNHGVLALGSDLDEAYYHSQAVEYLAQLNYLTGTLGGARLLTPEQVLEVAEKFKGYGQRSTQQGTSDARS